MTSYAFLDIDMSLMSRSSSEGQVHPGFGRFRNLIICPASNSANVLSCNFRMPMPARNINNSPINNIKNQDIKSVTDSQQIQITGEGDKRGSGAAGTCLQKDIHPIDEPRFRQGKFC
jgi:hypothetical protein